MAEDGNNRNGNGRNGPQQQRPPADLEKKRLKNENKQLKATLTQLMADRGMPEGPMGTGQGQSNFPLTSDDVRDMDILEGEDGASGGTWEPQPMMVGQQIPPSQVHPELLAKNSEDRMQEPKERSRLKNAMYNFHSAIASSPLKSIVSRILDWRVVGIAAAAAAIKAVYDIYPNLSLRGAGSEFVSNVKGMFNFIAEPITKLTGINFASWSGAGTIGSYVASAAFALSAVFNYKSLAKIANRLSSSALFLGLPTIVSDAGRFFEATGARTSGKFVDSLGPESSAAIIAFIGLRVASVFLPNGIPYADKIKGLAGRSGSKKRSESLSMRNAHGQRIPLDENGWPPGTEAWASPHTPPKPPSKSGKIGSAMLGAITFLPKKAIGAITYFPKKGIEALKDRFGGKRSPRTGEPAFAQAKTQEDYRAHAQYVLEAWEDGKTAPEKTIAILQGFMENAAGAEPQEWMPVFDGIIEGEPEERDTPQYEQFRRLLDNRAIQGAIKDIVEAHTRELETALRGDSGYSLREDISLPQSESVRSIAFRYSRHYQSLYGNTDLVAPIDSLGKAIIAVRDAKNQND